jgi:aminoglycoside/choline kinase family phosphotransferase
MSDRSGEIGRFLSEAGWGTAEAVPIAGDMSARRYWRLSQAGHSAILMDADAPMTPFLTMTEWLDRLDLSVPGIIAARPEAGLILMEDFGDVSLKAALSENPELERDVFGSCVDLLLHIRAAKPPRLSRPTAAELVEWTRLADDHYPGVCAEGLSGFRKVLEDLLQELLRGDCSVSLRDFHTENMMWLPRRAGYHRLGLLDYQDAFLTHPAYDLVSLLTDARTRVPRPLRESVADSYLERSGDDPETFKRAFAALSAQRNLRILGIFARAGRYAEYLPNTYGYFLEALEQPVFDHVRSDTLAALPAPAGAS